MRGTLLETLDTECHILQGKIYHFNKHSLMRSLSETSTSNRRLLQQILTDCINIQDLTGVQ